MALVGLALMAAIVGGLLLRSPAPAAADVEITHDNGRVVVRLTDLEATPAEIEAAASTEGLDIHVEQVPSGPSHVGRFVGEEVTSGGFTDVEHLDMEGVTFVAFSLPEDWAGKLTLLLGRPARAGEGYVAFTDAYAVGEPLACSQTLGGPLSALSEHLDGFETSVQTFADGQPDQVIDLDEALESGLGDAIVSGATATSPTSVVVDVEGPLPDGTGVAAARC
jgi:hypothetical protein